MAATTQDLQRQRRQRKRIERLKLYSALALLMAPTMIGMVVFDYIPKLETIYYSFFDWDGGQTLEYIGVNNYEEALIRDPAFWKSFTLVVILFAANLVKMWPSILTAIVLHRLRNQRWQYFYRVMFVIPMVIPALVWILLWKMFYDPTVGVLNRLLEYSGMMWVLRQLDWFMPQAAVSLAGLRSGSGLFTLGAGSVALGLTLLLGGWLVLRGLRLVSGLALGFGGGLLAIGLGSAVLGFEALGGGSVGVVLLGTAMLAVAGGFSLRVLQFLNLGGLLLAMWWLRARGGLELAPAVVWSAVSLGGAVLLAVAGRSALLGWLADRPSTAQHEATSAVRGAGWSVISAGSLLVLFTGIWTSPIGQFDSGSPSWLGNTNLIIPALLLWGFPWIGTVGVLIYLAGLQNISDDVYEAAELDGVGPIGKLFYIELPLILAQVRINLIFMTIGTLTGYEFVLLLLGPDGGPGNTGMVPGLHIFREGFYQVRFGYACALGMILFVVVLSLTILYNRFVRVEK